MIIYTKKVINMKNAMRFCFVLAFVMVAAVCFSQENPSTQKTDKKSENSVKATSATEGKTKKTKTKKEKETGISNKIAVSDQSLPDEKSTKKSKDKDKAVVPKKSK